MTPRQRVTQTMRAVHEDVKRAPRFFWLLGTAFFAYAIYRVESHAHTAGDRAEHVITGVAFTMGVALTPYVREALVALGQSAVGLFRQYRSARRNGAEDREPRSTSGSDT